MNTTEKLQAARDALKRAANVIELFDDATMSASYMLDSTDCAGIILALADSPDYAPSDAQPVQDGAISELAAYQYWAASQTEPVTAIGAWQARAHIAQRAPVADDVASHLTDAEIVQVLASLGTDAEKSIYDENPVLQVRTTVPGIRNIVAAYNAAALKAAPEPVSDAQLVVVSVDRPEFRTLLDESYRRWVDGLFPGKLIDRINAFGAQRYDAGYAEGVAPLIYRAAKDELKYWKRKAVDAEAERDELRAQLERHEGKLKAVWDEYEAFKLAQLARPAVDLSGLEVCYNMQQSGRGTRHAVWRDDVHALLSAAGTAAPEGEGGLLNALNQIADFEVPRHRSADESDLHTVQNIANAAIVDSQRSPAPAVEVAPVSGQAPVAWWDRAVGGFYLSESHIPASVAARGSITPLYAAPQPEATAQAPASAGGAQ